jgi:hypothetical protein
MVLEAIEDHMRGWRNGQMPLGEERVARGKLNIEHIMPRKWGMHWPLESSRSEAERDALINTIGNLTLLTGRLNAKVSNGPWLGPDGKRRGLENHDVLFMNRKLLDGARDAWTDSSIRTRSQELASLIVEIWPAPEGHRSTYGHEKPRIRHRVDLSDLLNAGWLEGGCPLFPRRRYADLACTLLADGRVDVEGRVYATPTEAAKAITGRRHVSGWRFFRVGEPKRLLGELRRDYLESFSEDVDEDEGSDDDEDDDDQS